MRGCGVLRFPSKAHHACAASACGLGGVAGGASASDSMAFPAGSATNCGCLIVGEHSWASAACCSEGRRDSRPFLPPLARFMHCFSCSGFPSLELVESPQARLRQRLHPELVAGKRGSVVFCEFRSVGASSLVRIRGNARNGVTRSARLRICVSGHTIAILIGGARCYTAQSVGKSASDRSYRCWLGPGRRSEIAKYSHGHTAISGQVLASASLPALPICNWFGLGRLVG